MSVFAEADRPRAPKRPGAPVTDRGRGAQDLLKGIHDHLRQEVERMVEVVDRVASGELEAAMARQAIDASAMVQNFRWVASFCAQRCRAVEVHHTLEDRRMFVDLGDLQPDLRPVLDRLSAEHVVIHDILVELDGLLAGLTDGEAARPVAGQARRLADALGSHLDYEEAELLEPIGRLSIDV